MKKFLTVFILLLWSAWTSASMELPPSLQDAAGSTYYRQLLKAHPWLAAYQPQFHSYHQQALQIVSGIQSLPGGSKVIENRPDLLSFEIQKVVPSDAKYFQLKKSTSRVMTTLVNTSAIQVFNNNTKGSFQGALTGVLSLLPKEQAKPIFALDTIDEQNEAVQKLIYEIPLETLRNRFKAENFGLVANEIDHDLIQYLLQQLVTNERSARLSALSYFIQRTSGSFDSDKVSLRYRSLEDFKREMSEFLTRYQFTNHSRLVDLIAKSDFERIDLKAGGEEVSSRIQIRELAVFPALFRGELGGDCSTTHSWPYPLSPFDRIFSVTVNDKEVGYVGGTMVTAKGKPTFYLRDVASGHLNVKHIEQIWSGFYHAQKLLGVEQIVIPDVHKLHDVNNTADFQTEIHRWYGGETNRTVVNIEYNPIDQQIRESFLDPKSKSPQYDSVQGNSYGLVMQGRPDVLQQYRVEQIANKVIEIKPIEKLSKQSIHDLLLRGINNDSSYLEDILEEQKPQFIQLLRAVVNYHKFNLDDYYTNVGNILKLYDIQLSQKLVHEWQDLFISGHLKADGAILEAQAGSSDWQKWTIDFVIASIMRSPDATPAYMVIRKNPQYFEKSEKFQKMVRALITPHGSASTVDEVAVGRLEPILIAGVKLQNMFDVSFEEIKMLKDSGISYIDELFQQKQVVNYLENPLQQDINVLDFHLPYAGKEAKKILNAPDKYSAQTVVAAALIMTRDGHIHSWQDGGRGKFEGLQHLIKWQDHPDVSPELRELIQKKFGKEMKAYSEKSSSEGCEDKLAGLRRKFLGPDAE